MTDRQRLKAVRSQELSALEYRWAREALNVGDLAYATEWQKVAARRSEIARNAQETR